MPKREPQMYAVFFEGADGGHLAELTLTKRDTAAARRHAELIFSKLTVKEVRPVSGPEEIKRLAKEVVDAHPSRVPIDEKTGGVPNLALSDPDLLADDDDQA